MFLKIFGLLFVFVGGVFAKTLTVDVEGDWAPFTDGFFSGSSGDLRGCLTFANRKLDDYEIRFDLANPKISLLNDLPVLNLYSAKRMKIDGENPRGGKVVIDGRRGARGFFAFQGTVEISNLVLVDTLERGSNSGGGKAGAGGALFIRKTASVFLQNVEIKGSQARGGNGVMGVLDEEETWNTNRQTRSDSRECLNDFGCGGNWLRSMSGAGGGAGSVSGCGGGGGFGGAIFLTEGGSLIVSGNLQIERGAVAGGKPGVSSAKEGAAAGAGIFIQSGSSVSNQITFSPGLGNEIAVYDSIADDSLCSIPAGHSFKPGDGIGSSVLIDGPGKVVLTGIHSYGGLTDLRRGTLAFQGVLAGPVFIGKQGILKGAGEIGKSVQIEGKLALASSDTLAAHSCVFSSGSEFSIAIDPNRSSKFILKEKVEIERGAKLRIEAHPGEYAIGTSYPILESEEGMISGEFEIENPVGFRFEAEVDSSGHVLFLRFL